MKNLISRFIREEEGQDLIEYVLLAALLAIAAIAALQTLGPAINTKFGSVETALEGAGS